MYKTCYYNKRRVQAFFHANSISVHELNNYTFYEHVKRTRHKAAVYYESLDDFVAPVDNRDYRTVIGGKLFSISHRNRYSRHFTTPTIAIILNSVCSHPTGLFMFILKKKKITFFKPVQMRGEAGSSPVF